MKLKSFLFCSLLISATFICNEPIAARPAAHHASPTAPLVLMTDFGTRDGAVSEVKGVAYGVSQNLLISDLSHEIAPGDIFEGAYRLYQTAPYWPKGSVFVSVVDPGVGTQRLSIALKTRAGHYYIGPNNGLFTLIAETEGIEEIRTIDEATNRLPGSQDSHTFYGRDVFGFTGARLASGTISFAQIGPVISQIQFVKLNYQRAEIRDNNIMGMIPVLDVNYGNVWSNVSKEMFESQGFKIGDMIHVKIYHDGALVNEVTAPYVNTFGNVPDGAALVYINSVMNVSLALNMGDYAKTYGVSSGNEWSIKFSKP